MRELIVVILVSALSACSVCPNDIHRACARRGCVDKVKVLLAQDASLVSKLDATGMPPLHYAAEGPIAEALLAAGADINAKAGANQATPLFAALESDRGPVAKLLFQRGAERPYDIQKALTEAVQNGKASSAEALIDTGASVNYADPATGVTPLHTAALSDQLKLARLLLDKGAYPNAGLHANARSMSFGPGGSGTQFKTETADASGATPLSLARSPEMRALLRAKGAQ